MLILQIKLVWELTSTGSDDKYIAGVTDIPFASSLLIVLATFTLALNDLLSSLPEHQILVAPRINSTSSLICFSVRFLDFSLDVCKGYKNYFASYLVVFLHNIHIGISIYSAFVLCNLPKC